MPFYWHFCLKHIPFRPKIAIWLCQNFGCGHDILMIPLLKHVWIRKASWESFRSPIFFHRRKLVFDTWVQTLCGTYSSTQYVLNYTRLEAYVSFHINALVRINIVRRFSFGQNYKFYLHPRLSGGFNSLIVRTMAQTIKRPIIDGPIFVI